MIYFLDTNICIYYLNKMPAGILEKFNEIGNKNIKIPSVVSAELYYGAEKSVKREYNLKRYAEFLSWFNIDEFQRISKLRVENWK